MSICGDFDEGEVENGVGVIQVLGLVVCCFAMVRVSECFDVLCFVVLQVSSADLLWVD